VTKIPYVVAAPGIYLSRTCQKPNCKPDIEGNDWRQGETTRFPKLLENCAPAGLTVDSLAFPWMKAGFRAFPPAFQRGFCGEPLARRIFEDFESTLESKPLVAISYRLLRLLPVPSGCVSLRIQRWTSWAELFTGQLQGKPIRSRARSTVGPRTTT
jgi:hypothetical protein